jgi:type 1 glutamine amidotransferase
MFLLPTLLALLPALVAPEPLSGALEPLVPATAKKLPVLLVSGANNHWWQWTTPQIEEILEESGKFDVEITLEPAKAFADREALAAWSAIVLDYNGPRWGETAEANFIAAIEGGVGLVVVHAADNAFKGWKEYEEMVALMWRDGTGHGAFHSFDVNITDRDHPITRDMPDMIAHPDELYHRLVHMHDTDYRVLASAWSDPETGGTGEAEPMVLVKSYGEGRIFHNVLGHAWIGVEPSKVSFRDPQFRDLMVRGTEWAATGEVTATRVPNTLTEAESEYGWELLFDGRSAAGWRGFRSEGFPEKGWEISDGALHVVAGGGGGDLITAKAYRDFEFAFDWKVSPGANSGIMFHVSEEYGAPWETGPEYQILDDSAAGHGGGNPKTSAGALYALVAAEGHTVRPPLEWNRGRILLVGNHLEHWVNGVRVLSITLHDENWKEMVAASKFGAMPGFGLEKSGFLCLQDHGNDVWFRNLKIRNLDPDPAREVALFNGTDLTGWTGHLNDGGQLADVWSVTDEGVLVCKGRPIGYLHTEADHTNYTLRLEWRFNPVTKQAGNSGVLMRMIGPHQVWPRSIEAQLQSGAAGDYWNIENFPMQAVPERTNGRNTRRTATNENPIGEWNLYEITLWHGHCVLRVNGEILNQAWDCLEIPGKLCLQSEGAEIHFRDIRLMPMR